MKVVPHLPSVEVLPSPKERWGEKVLEVVRGTRGAGPLTPTTGSKGSGRSPLLPSFICVPKITVYKERDPPVA